MGPATVGHDALMAAYAEADHEQRLRLSRVGCILAMVLVPLFWGLDWVVYPDLVWAMGLSRLLCDLGIAIVFLVLATPLGRRWIRFLGIAWALLPGIAISWMILISQGEASPYYAGLNLVMIIVSLLMPWTASEVVVLCFLTVGLYFLACVRHTPETALAWSSLTVNLYFMISTAVICVTAGIFSGRRRFADFHLRHQLDQRNRELAEMDRLKTEFYANVSHELRTPLTLILAPLEKLLTEGAIDRGTRSVLELMRGNALRLLRLINDILEVVKLEGGKLVLKRTRLDLAAWVAGIARSVHHLAELKGIRLVLPEQGPAVSAVFDPLMMEKVLLNLLSNAIKFTPRDGEIRIGWGGDGDGPWFTVSDTGIGIEEKELPRLFTRFHQVDGSATRQYRGLGLGLSLSRDLVERHGGTMTVTSRHGKGSTFRVGIPAVIPADPGGADEPVDRHPAPEEDLIVRAYREADRYGHSFDTPEADLPLETILAPDRPTGLSDLVLVADDEPDMRRFLVTLLREQHRVVAVGDGERALAMARLHKPRLVLLDLMMPKLDGMQVCHALRADGGICDTKIVLLTARADDETKLGALQGGADDFLTKPFSSQEVQSRVANLLHNAALEASLRERNHELQTTLDRLRQAEAQLVQSEKMHALGSLAAGLLHEINNPLNYTLVAVQYAQESFTGKDPAIAEVLKDIHDGMKRIADIISSLRAFAYPETISLNDHFPAKEAIELCCRFTAHLCEGITVDAQTPGDPLVAGSVNQVSMVLVNLVSNAAKAIRAVTDGRPGRITIVAQAKADQVVFTVTDNGVGMEAERMRRAFEPFYTSSEVGEGMGLGLTICHTIIRNHQGEISLTSRPGEGTTVIVVLPTTSPIPAEEHHEATT